MTSTAPRIITRPSADTMESLRIVLEAHDLKVSGFELVKAALGGDWPASVEVSGPGDQYLRDLSPSVARALAWALMDAADAAEGK